MPQREEDLWISAGVVRDILGEAICTTSAAGGVAVAVWPGSATTGLKASIVILRAANPFWVRFNTPAVIGYPSAELSAGVDYVFPLAPQVNSLFFVAPVNTTVLTRWIIR